MFHAFLLLHALAIPSGSASQDEKTAALEATVEPFVGPITQLVLSPDGRRAATIGEDHRLILWDTAGRRKIASFEGAGEPAVRFAFSPDSKILATAAPWWSERQVRAFRAHDGLELEGLEKIALGEGRSYTISTGEAGGTGSKIVGPAIYRHRSGATIFHPSDHRGLAVSSRPKLAPPVTRWRQPWRISADGTRIAYFRTQGLVGGDIPQGSKRRTLDARVYDVATGAEVARQSFEDVVPERDPYYTEALGFDFEQIAFVRRGSVEVHRFADRKLLRTFGEDVTALLLPGADRWITGHRDGTVRAWQAERPVSTWHACARRVRYLRIEGNVLFAGGRSVTAIRDGEVLRRTDSIQGTAGGRWLLLRDHHEIGVWNGDEWIDSLVAAATYSETDSRHIPAQVAGRTLAYVESGELVLRDLEARRQLARLNDHRGRVRRLAWGKAGLLAHGRKESVLLEPAPWRVFRRYGTRAVRAAGTRIVDFSRWTEEEPRSFTVAKDGSVAAVRDGSTIRAVEPEGATELWRSPPAGRHQEPIALSHDGTLLAAAWNEGRGQCRLRVFSLPSGEVVLDRRVPAHRAEILVFAPNGEILAARVSGSSAGSGNVIFYSLDGKELHRMHTGPASMRETEDERSFAFTPDASCAAGASFRRSVAVFDFARRAPVLELATPARTYSHFVRLFMSPTGRSFALFFRERDVTHWISRAEGLDPAARIWTRNATEPIAFLPNGDLLAVTPRGVEHWDATTRRRRQRLTEATGSGVWASPDGRRFAILDQSRIRLFARR